jgi:tetratricopeptide (TPR) repeat protein
LKGHEAAAWVQIGKLHQILGNKKSAIDAWAKVLEYSPHAQGLQIAANEFLAGYGSILLEEGHVQKAIPVLQESLDLGETAEARLKLADAWQQSGDIDQAVVGWKRVIELSPQSRHARESLAEISLRQGRFDEARAWLDPLLSTSDLMASTAYLMQRICLAKGDRAAGDEWQKRVANLRRMEHVQSVADRIVTSSPDSVWSRAIRAHRFAQAGNWQEASLMMASINDSESEEPFIQQLTTAIRQRGVLPSLELLPLQHFQ